MSEACARENDQAPLTACDQGATWTYMDALRFGPIIADLNVRPYNKVCAESDIEACEVVVKGSDQSKAQDAGVRC